MPEYTEKDIFRSAINTYGAVMQITVAFEEMSELQKELCKYIRGSGSKENISEEIADVEIMMEQMKMIFNCEAAVLQVREKKVKRLKERIEQNEGADWLIANDITVKDWISVKDRLPEIGRSVIAYNALAKCAAEAMYKGEGMFLQFRWPARLQEHEITHWMPLPPPPKGEAE